MAKALYKLKLTDFLPGGTRRYMSRNYDFEDDKATGQRYYPSPPHDGRATHRSIFLMMYDIAVVTVAVLGATIGLERLIR